MLVVRIDPLRFLAGCRKMQLNQTLSILSVSIGFLYVYCCLFRVRTDPGKVWKVTEFRVEIFQVWKIMENDLRYGKVTEFVTADLEN